MNREPTDAIKTDSKRTIQKRTEATDDLIGNKIADKITNTAKSPQKNCIIMITNY